MTTITKFLLFRTNDIIDGGVHLIIETYNYFIILIRK